MDYRRLIVLGIFFCLLGTVDAALSSEIRIESVTWDPIFVEPGDEVTVYAKFLNRPIDVRFAVQNPDNVARGQDPSVFYKAMLEPADDLSQEYVIIKKSEKNVGHLFIGESWTTPFELKIRENAVATTYKMRFSVLETDMDGTYEEVVKISEFELPIQGVVKFNVGSDNTVKLGSVNDITVDLKNEGLGDAKHVMLALDLSDPFTAVQTSELYIGDYAAKESKSVTFKVSVGSETEANVYSIPLTITYIDDNGTEVSEERDIGVRIDAKPDMKVGLESADTFTSGMSGTVSIEVVNEGFIDAKFVRLILEPTEDYDVKSINEFYIGNLDSDDIETDEFEIDVKDTNKSSIPLKVRLQYKGAGSDLEYSNECDVELKVLSKEEYAKTLGGGDNTGLILSLLIALPVIFIAILAVWFVIKLFLLVKDYINARLFSK